MSIIINILVLLNIFFIISLFLLITDVFYSGDYDYFAYLYHVLNFMTGHEFTSNSIIDADIIRTIGHTNHPSTQFPSYEL